MYMSISMYTVTNWFDAVIPALKCWNEPTKNSVCSKGDSANIFNSDYFKIYDNYCALYIKKINKQTLNWMANHFTNGHHWTITVLAPIPCLQLHEWQMVRPSWLQANTYREDRTWHYYSHTVYLKRRDGCTAAQDEVNGWRAELSYDT